ncbi:MAG: cobalamin-dependent protein, partial [Candidatus Helarchaeota archaeon]|nr:cobalamin-dependent protein [Candidatus Helarchaeota archaeon]
MASEDDLIAAMAELNEDRAMEAVRELLKKKSALDIINVAREGMQHVGEKFAAKEFFLADLIFSAEIFQEIMTLVEPELKKGSETSYIGKVLIGTVKNDIHDIGKNIMASLLRASGFEVVDLGVDVPVEKFVDAIKREKPRVVGLSGLLTIAIDEMKKTIEAIKANGLRDNLKIIIG